MKKLIRILTIQSLKELLRYKSFSFLIFFLILADRVVHRLVKSPGHGIGWPAGFELVGERTARFIFEQLPDKFSQWLFTPRVITIAAGLFLLKQVISLWPSSDMRRMHRRERGRFGVMEALTALRWFQVAWDALAVGWVCAVMAVWVGMGYFIGWGVWAHTGATASVLIPAGLAAMAFPVVIAGFSYSSKLAVIRHGTFGGRFRLFLKLFTHWRLLWTSWLFFTSRVVLEALFVAFIPLVAMLFMDNFWLRMAVAAVSATPVYAYLKMASFKFFLEVYSSDALVRMEYRDYYATLEGPQEDVAGNVHLDAKKGADLI